MVGFCLFWCWLGLFSVRLLVASILKLSRFFAKFRAGILFNRLRVATTDNAQSLIGTEKKINLNPKQLGPYFRMLDDIGKTARLFSRTCSTAL